MAKAKYIIVVSKYTKSGILGHCSYIEDKKIRIISPGISKDFKIIKDKRRLDEFKNKYNLQNKKIILHVGNDNWYKNFKTLINAFYLLEEENKFLIKIGKITEEEKRLINKYKLHQKILNLQNISKEELINFYNAADVFVFPSLSEGFGWPPLEAMACGCPVIASNKGSLPEVCRDTCIYINPNNPKDIADKIKQILEDKKLKQKQIKKGKYNSKRFNWKKTVNLIIDITKNL